jgi:tetratricopeptide (TPR) repeat protein
MADPNPYPGSPSLSAEAREKVRQTFRHTLQLAKSGRNEEALLGCDFILKMDARFQPARRLLETLRGVASGSVVDLTPFDEFLGDGGAPAPAAPAPRAAPAAPAAKPAAPAVPEKATLDDLAFDDFGGDLGMDAGAAPAPPRAAARAAGPSPFPMPSAPSAPMPPSPAATQALDPSLLGPFPGAAPPAPPPPPAFDLGGFEEPAPAYAEVAPAAATPPPFPAPEVPAAGAVDPRIAQFLKQGDEAMARGQVQEAIDLWSRVFLIDLANEEASSRIDSARDRQAESARKIDVLLSEGIQLYDAGDLASARSKFLDVLALSETDGTARSYLNQIEAAMADKPPVTLGGSADYMKSELEPTHIPSFAPSGDFGDEAAARMPVSPLAEEPSPEEEREAPRERKTSIRIDGRVLLAAALIVLVGIGFLATRLFKKKPPAAAPTGVARAVRPGAPGPPSAPPADDPIARAKAFLDQGNMEEARNLASAIPDNDPRYPEALAILERIKSSAPPTPAAAALSAAVLDEMRIAGMAAVKASRYIDAVKNLDPVTKARPDDTEAIQLLTKARERVAAMGSAVRAYNEQDYQSAVRLLWDIRKQDPRNQDVEDFLFRAYFNEAVQDLQAGNATKAGEAFKESLALRPSDGEVQRHIKFVKKYSKGPTDLLSRIYVKHLTPRP